MELQTEQPPVDSGDVSQETQTLTTETSAEQNTSAPTEESNEGFGAKLKKAFSDQPDAGDDQRKEAQTNKPEKQKAEQAQPQDSGFKPFSWKDEKTGQEIKISSLNEFKAGYMRQADYTRKTQEVASLRKSYEEFESRIEQDPAFKTLIGLGYNDPNFARVAIAHYQELAKQGKVNLAEVKANALERQIKQRDESEQAQRAEQEKAHYSSLVEQHVHQIREELGEKFTPAYFNKLRGIVKAELAPDLYQAHKFEQAECQAEREEALRSVQQRQAVLSEGASPRGSAVPTASEAIADPAAFGRALKQAFKSQ